MKAIEIKVNYNKASLIGNLFDITSGSRGITSIEFKFSNEWIGFTKTAILYIDKYNENTAVKIILDERNSIDAKYLSNLIAQKCDLYIGVFGDKGEQRITTNVVCVQIREGVPTEGIDAEINVNLYNQIIQIMDSTKQIAQSIRDDADSGIFKGDKGDVGDTGPIGPPGEPGKDGVPGIDGKDGYTPVKGVDYFTEAEKAEIVQDVTDGIDLSDKPTKYTLKGNNEPTTNASEYPDVKLGDFCVNEVYRAWICEYLHEDSNTVVWSEIITPTSPFLSNYYYTKSLIDNMLKEKENKSDWELIRKIEITEELGAVEITKDKEENSFKYDDIMVIANNVKGSNSGNWWVSVKTTANPANSGLIQVGNANPLSSTTAKVIHTKIKRMFGVNRYEYDSSYKNTTAYASTTNKGTYAPPFELSEETKINYIRIHFSTNNTVNSGTIVVYGRKRR